jgi:hypothetical protein
MYCYLQQEKLGGNKFNENGENSVARTPCNYFNQIVTEKALSLEVTEDLELYNVR